MRAYIGVATDRQPAPAGLPSSSHCGKEKWGNMKHISELSAGIVNAAKYTESPIEVTLFHELMRRREIVLCQSDDKPQGEGYFLYPQHQVGPYRADFLILAAGYPTGNKVWPPRLRSIVCIECDGSQFHSTKEQLEYDKTRDDYFLSHGIKTLRFTGSQINSNVKFCVDEIIHIVDMQLKKSGGNNVKG